MQNKDAFAKTEYDIGCVEDFPQRIDLLSQIPIACRPYRLPHSKMEVMKKEIDKLLHTKVISPSRSPYAAPCLLVYKKNGKPRLVIDYRKLNKIVKPVQYPLPHLETALQSLGGNKIFSTLDLLSGYHQLPLREEDKEKTAFTTGFGLFHYNRVPFGMISSGAHMQLCIERILADINGRGCLVYIDDIIIYGKDQEEHDRNLAMVLKRLASAGYKVSIPKCVFRSSKVECLGHIVSSQGILPNPSKTAPLTTMKRPTTVKGIRSFLGLCGYFQKFVDGFSSIAKPLTDQIKKNTTKIKWNAEC